ncbi:MAG: hypothetical protein AAGC88_04770 [Bacteroidota bacterium]
MQLIMKTHHFLLLLSLSALISCTDDLGKTTVTYERANAIYGDLESFRNQQLYTSPREINDPGKIFIGDRYLLIGEEGEGIHVFDNANPENPTNLGFIQIFGNREFFLDGSDLYAEIVYDMVKIDLTSIQEPQLINRVTGVFAQPQFNDQGEAIIGFNYEEVTEEYDINDPDLEWLGVGGETFFFDFNNRLIPRSAVPTSFAGNSSDGMGTVNRIASHEGFVYVISRTELSIFDAEGAFDLLAKRNIGWGMETIYPLEDKLFIGSRNSMEVFNITNPTNPDRESSYFHENSCDPVLPVNTTTAYVTLRTGDFSECPGDTNELLVLDVVSSTGWNAMELQSFEMLSPYGMSLIGNRLYVGEGANGLAVFDASDNRNLQFIERDRTVEAYDIIGHPSRADVILIAGPTGFSQYRIGAAEEFLLISNVAF